MQHFSFDWRGNSLSEGGEGSRRTTPRDITSPFQAGVSPFNKKLRQEGV